MASTWRHAVIQKAFTLEEPMPLPRCVAPSQPNPNDNARLEVGRPSGRAALVAVT